MRRRLGLGMIALGLIAVCVCVGYIGWISYLRYREQVSPSTVQVVMLRDGHQVPLAQPTQLPRPLPSPQAAAKTVSNEPVSTPEPQPVLPPERLHIPKIGVDDLVTLGSVEHLPRFKAVGWLIGSGFPGAQGNIVLFGHAGGPYGVFGRLHELAPGDEFWVTTQGGEVHYQVESSFETTPDDVAVLLPTDEATATLITCSGPWNAEQQTNELRRVVVARLVTPTTP